MKNVALDVSVSLLIALENASSGVSDTTSVRGFDVSSSNNTPRTSEQTAAFPLMLSTWVERRVLDDVSYTPTLPFSCTNATNLPSLISLVRILQLASGMAR